jgi:hypothetical protein
MKLLRGLCPTWVRITAWSLYDVGLNQWQSLSDLPARGVFKNQQNVALRRERANSWSKMARCMSYLRKGPTVQSKMVHYKSYVWNGLLMGVKWHSALATYTTFLNYGPSGGYCPQGPKLGVLFNPFFNFCPGELPIGGPVWACNYYLPPGSKIVGVLFDLFFKFWGRGNCP